MTYCTVVSGGSYLDSGCGYCKPPLNVRLNEINIYFYKKRESFTGKEHTALLREIRGLATSVTATDCPIQAGQEGALLREIRGLATCVTATDSSIQAGQEGTLLREIRERPSNPRKGRMDQSRRER